MKAEFFVSFLWGILASFLDAASAFLPQIYIFLLSTDNIIIQSKNVSV